MTHTNKTVLITGSNRGIGLGFVMAYLQRNFKVIATCRSPKNAESLEKLLHEYPQNLIIEKLDVTSPENLLKASSPKIINLSSQMGALHAAKGFGYAYRMSKAALNMLTRCYAMENPHVITVAIRPGWVKTKMGGPDATLNIEESVEKMINIIDNLHSNDSGSFFDNEKNVCPW